MKQESGKKGQKEAASVASSAGQFELTIGQKVEVLDFCNIWRPGELRRLNSWDNTVLVHFDGTDDATCNEWFEVASGRLRMARKDTTNAIKIPKADRLAMASSMMQDENKEDNKQQLAKDGVKMLAKERKGALVSLFRKGTFVIASWVDGNLYPAVIVRVLSDFSYLVQFVDGCRWALGSHCVARTLTRTEYERLVDSPINGMEFLKSARANSRGPLSPAGNCKDPAPPPRKRFRLASPTPVPAPSPVVEVVEKPQKIGRTSKNSRKSLPPEAPVKFAEQKNLTKTKQIGRRERRNSCAPALGASSAGFKSKASVRSVSPLTSPIIKSRRSVKNAEQPQANEDASIRPAEKVVKAETIPRRVSTRERRPVQREFPPPPREPLVKVRNSLSMFDDIQRIQAEAAIEVEAAIVAVAAQDDKISPKTEPLMSLDIAEKTNFVENQELPLHYSEVKADVADSVGEQVSSALGNVDDATLLASLTSGFKGSCEVCGCALGSAAGRARHLWSKHPEAWALLRGSQSQPACNSPSNKPLEISQREFPPVVKVHNGPDENQLNTAETAIEGVDTAKVVVAARDGESSPKDRPHTSLGISTEASSVENQELSVDVEKIIGRRRSLRRSGVSQENRGEAAVEDRSRSTVP